MRIVEQAPGKNCHPLLFRATRMFLFKALSHHNNLFRLFRSVADEKADEGPLYVCMIDHLLILVNKMIYSESPEKNARQ